MNSIWFSSATPFYIWYFAFALAGIFGLIVANQVTAKYVKPKMSQTAQINPVNARKDKKENKKKN